MNLEMDPCFYNKFINDFNQSDLLRPGEKGLCHHICIFFLRNDESPWANIRSAEEAMQGALNINFAEKTRIIRWSRARSSLIEYCDELPTYTSQVKPYTSYYIRIRFGNETHTHAACAVIGEENECVLFDPNWGFEYIKVFDMEIDHAICLFLKITCRLFTGTPPSFDFSAEKQL